MGGCRCSFRSCENCTANQPGMHFFHFPFRDLERCEKWALYSNNLSFMQLPVSKLRNKVVCQMHFRDKCFMNSRKESLTKFAIPTIMKSHKGEIIDFEIDEKDKSVYDIHAHKTLVKPDILTTYMHSSSRPIEILNTMEDVALEEEPINIETEQNNFEFILSDIDYVEEEQSNQKDDLILEMKVEQQPSQQKLLNGCVSRVYKLKRHNKNPVSVMARPILTKINAKRKNLKAKSKQPQLNVEVMIPDEVVISGEEMITDASEILGAADGVSESHATHSGYGKKLAELNKLRNQSKIDEKIIQNLQQDEVIVEVIQKLSEKTTEIVDLENSVAAQNKQHQRLLKSHSQIPKQTSPTPGGKVKQEKNTLTKSQLFQGIRRYLNPSMVALLRMELFGDAERQYKQDERDFAMELMSLSMPEATSNVYDYMRSEWRFRLPPKSDVMQWLKQRETADDESVDDDAC